MSDAPLDREALLEELEGDLEFLQETYEMFVEDAPVLLQQAQSALALEDAAQVSTTAHTLKGMVGNFHAGPAFELARQLETLGKENHLQGGQQVMEALTAELERLKQALEGILGEN